MIDPLFRILAIDGGGIRGLFPASFLAHIEQYTSKAIANHFDLVVGTSTGSIIALGLASGFSAAETLKFYEEYAPTIFPGNASLSYKVKQIFRPKYNIEPLIAALQQTFGEHKLNELQVPVCIPSYELVSGVPRVFKTDHHPDLHWGGDQVVWKVAVASCAAPTYFPAFQLETDDAYIDGGIWGNNPVMVGVTEGVRYFGKRLDEIAVLSIGTGSRAFRLPHATARSMGIFGWARGGPRFLNAVFAAQSQSAERTARLLLSHDHYMRIDADLEVALPLDNYQVARQLIERGAQKGREHRTEIQRLFLATHRQSTWRPWANPD